MSQLGSLAVEALLVEARLSPKPGLVDAENSGAHVDMDLPLLERSARALAPAFDACVAWGAQDDPNIAELQQIGLDGEHRMLEATRGVNTHKGALFALGLWCAALAAGDDVDAARQLVRRWALELTEQASTTAPTPPTAGDRARALGVGGARGQAAQGYPLVFDVALPILASHRGDDVESALLRALVALIAANDDSNLVARGGLAGLARAKQWASDLQSQDVDDDALRDQLRQANTWFTAQRLSPGGSADLLALTWFLDQRDR